MINFSSLVGEEVAKPVVKEPVKKKLSAVDIGIPKKLTSTEKQQLRDIAHKIEPGFKIPTSTYKVIAQWCDNCDDIKSHALNQQGTKLRCLCCKKDKLIKKQ